jgi:hypothetical protein
MSEMDLKVVLLKLQDIHDSVKRLDPPMSGWVTSALMAVALERKRQDTKWGPQNHPTGCFFSRENAHDEAARKAEFEHLAKMGKMTWRAILAEEVAELFNTASDEEAYTEAVQVAAVAVAMAESIRRRRDNQ